MAPTFRAAKTLPVAPTLMAALLLALALAACGQAPAGTGGTGATNPPVTGGQATAPAGTGGDPGGPGADACALLTDEEIADITGYSVAAMDPDPVDTTYPSACEWTFEGTPWQLVLGVLPSGGGDFLDRTVEIEGGTPIEGLGDRAVRTDVSDSIMVIVGGTLLDLQFVAFGEPDDAAVRLAELAVAGLGQ